MRIANSVTNKADADLIMRRWARILVDKLDSVQGSFGPVFSGADIYQPIRCSAQSLLPEGSSK
jgi:hypothetical protein